MSGINVYKIVNNKPVLVGYLKSEEEIDKEVLSKIREKYPLEEELKILRLKETNPDLFQEYNDYVEECRAEGKAKKAEIAQKLEELETTTIKDGDEERVIYIEE